MGTIEVLGKWNLGKNAFETEFDSSLMGKSFGIATYEPIKNNDSDEFDYLIRFSEENEDPYYYCFHDEGCHIIYHRFLPEDYEDFGF